MIGAAIASLIPTQRAYRNASLENPQFSLNDPAAYEALTGGHKSASGVVVTHEGSLALSAVWQSLSLISGDGSKLPLYPYKRLNDDDREIADKHTSYTAVAIRANPWKSAKVFWADLIVHMLLWRNGYAFINRTGPVLELYNLLPDRTAPRWIKVPDPRAKNGYRAELIYETEVDGHLETVLPRNILHVRQWSLDGLVAPDMVKAAKDAWGLALAAQNFESKFFKNGARKGGILEVPAGMSKPAKDTLEEGFRKSYEEGDNPFKTVILRDGAKFHEGQVSPKEGEVVEQNESGKRDVASYFNIPPSKLGIRDSVSYNSFEQDNLSYLHGCLHHVCDSISDECDMKLLSEQELLTDSHYFEHNYSQFIQSDWVSLNQGLEVMRRNEVINADEWRRKLNMNKRPDGGGGEYINPNTRSPADEPKKPEPPKKKPDPKAHRELFVNTFGRMARRVSFDALNSYGNAGRFESWIASKSAEHRALFDEASSPVVAAYVSVFGGDGGSMLQSAKEEMFGPLMSDLSTMYAADAAKSDVESYLQTFERTAPERVAAKIMELNNV